MKVQLTIDTQPEKSITLLCKPGQVITIKLNSDEFKVTIDERKKPMSPSQIRKARQNKQPIPHDSLPQDSDLKQDDLAYWYVSNWELSRDTSLVLMRNNLWPQKVATMTYEELCGLNKIGQTRALEILSKRPTIAFSAPLLLHA